MVERQLFLQAVTRVGFYLETSIFLPCTIQNRQGKAGRGVNAGNVRDFSGQRLRNLVRLLDSEQAVFSVCRPEISTAFLPSPQVISLFFTVDVLSLKPYNGNVRLLPKSRALRQEEPCVGLCKGWALFRRKGPKRGAGLTSKCRCPGMVPKPHTKEDYRVQGACLHSSEPPRFRDFPDCPHFPPGPLLEPLKASPLKMRLLWS